MQQQDKTQRVKIITLSVIAATIITTPKPVFINFPERRLRSFAPNNAPVAAPRAVLKISPISEKPAEVYTKTPANRWKNVCLLQQNNLKKAKVHL